MLGEMSVTCGRLTPEESPTNSSRFGEPLWGSVIRPAVAWSASAAETVAGVALGLPARCKAAAPAACGEAIEVPDISSEQVSQDIDAERMFDPGAKRSNRDP